MSDRVLMAKTTGLTLMERWFRTFKYEEAYLTQYANIREARQAISKFINNYNFNRCHSAIGNIPPVQAYYPALLIHDTV